MKKCALSILVAFTLLLLPSCSSTDRIETINGAEFQVNAHGDSYGSIGDANIPDDLSNSEEIRNYLPDLVNARTTDGKEGYVKTDDLFSAQGEIVVYESDGVTEIGTMKSNEVTDED